MKAVLGYGTILLAVFSVVALIASRFGTDRSLTLADRLAADLAFWLSLLLMAATALVMTVAVLALRYRTRRAKLRRQE